MEKKITTIEILNSLKNALLFEKEQEEINYYAILLADRIYVKNERQSYNDMLHSFGYREIEKGKSK